MKLLESLRAATTSLHEQLHSHQALCLLTEDSVSHAYHLQALQNFYGFYEPLERRYRATATLPHEFPAGDITRRLESDLHRAGISAGSLDTLEEPDEPFSQEQAIAYLYLREGSGLGGKIISKNLARRLALEPGTDNQFFWGHGADTGKNWQKFLRKLDELESGINIDETADYAAFLFQKLASWLSRKDNPNATATA